MENFNSATRLAKILECIFSKQVSSGFGGIGHIAPSQRYSECILGQKVDPNRAMQDVDENRTVLESYYELRKLFDEVGHDLDDAQGMSDDRRERYRQNIESLKKCTIYNGGGGGGFIQQGGVDTIGVNFLYDVADIIEHESRVEQPTLDDIRKAVDQLLTEVLRAKLPLGLRRILLDATHLCLKSIDLYRVRGAKGLQQGYSNLLGDLLLIAKNPVSNAEIKHPTLWERITIVLSVLNLAVTTAKNIQTASDSVTDVIELLKIQQG